MNKAVLDTDILSLLLRQDASVVTTAREYLNQYARLTISIITQYEVLRGLSTKQATTQIQDFNLFCQSVEVIGLTTSIVARAASVYATLRNQGITIGDADILIAATCLESGYEIATNNHSHFRHIPGLTTQRWL